MAHRRQLGQIGRFSASERRSLEIEPVISNDFEFCVRANSISGKRRFWVGVRWIFWVKNCAFVNFNLPNSLSLSLSDLDGNSTHLCSVDLANSKQFLARFLAALSSIAQLCGLHRETLGDPTVRYVADDSSDSRLRLLDGRRVSKRAALLSGEEFRRALQRPQTGKRR